jgi:hypothetical protein
MSDDYLSRLTAENNRLVTELFKLQQELSNNTANVNWYRKLLETERNHNKIDCDELTRLLKRNTFLEDKMHEFTELAKHREAYIKEIKRRYIIEVINKPKQFEYET